MEATNMMKSFPSDRICICIKSRKNRNFPLHLKADICFFELYKFPNNAWVKGRKGKYVKGEKRMKNTMSEKFQSKHIFWPHINWVSSIFFNLTVHSLWQKKDKDFRISHTKKFLIKHDNKCHTINLVSKRECAYIWVKACNLVTLTRNRRIINMLF